jgi:hypothetical protein
MTLKHLPWSYTCESWHPVLIHWKAFAIFFNSPSIQTMEWNATLPKRYIAERTRHDAREARIPVRRASLSKFKLVLANSELGHAGGSGDALAGAAEAATCSRLREI